MTQKGGRGGKGANEKKGQQHTMQTRTDLARGTPLKHGGELRCPGKGRDAT